MRYGDWALIYESVYYVLDRELTVFLDVQQAINLTLMDEFSRRGIQVRLSDIESRKRAATERARKRPPPATAGA